MATSYEEKKIVLTMNPDELRELADKMEKEYPLKMVGDSCFIANLVYSGHFTLDLHADQGWFNDRENQKNGKTHTS